MRLGIGRRSSWQLALLIALLGVIPLGSLAYLVQQRAAAAVRTQARDSLSSSASLTSSFLAEQLRGITAVMESYASRRLLRDALEDTRGADTRELTRHMSELHDARSEVLNGAGLVDAAGTMIASTVTSAVGRDFSFRDWFHGVMSTGKSYASEAIVGASPGSPLAIGIATPVRDRNQRVIGIIVAGYSLDRFQTFVETLATNQGIDVTVTDQRGVVIARPGSVPTRLESHKSDPRVSAALVGKSGVTDSARNAAGQRVLSAYAPVLEFDWTVVAELPHARAYGEVGRLQAHVILITVPLALLFALSGVLLARSIRARDLARDRLERVSVETRALLDSTAEAIWGIDREGKALFVNRATHDILGWEPEELIGRVMHDVVHHTRPDGSSFPRSECPIMSVALTGDPVRVDTDVLWRKDGTSFPVEYRATPLVVDGKVIGAVVTSLDISDRLQAADARRAIEAERRLEKSYRRLELLRDIDKGILAAVSLEELATQTLDRLRGLIPTEHCRLVFFDLERQEARVFAASTPGGPQPGARVALSDTPFARVVESLQRGERLVLNLDEETDSPALAQQRAAGIRTVSIVPLRSNGELVAMLTFSTSGTTPMDEEEFQVAEEVGNQVAIALRMWQFEGEVALRLELARSNERLRAADEMKNLFLAAVSHDVRGRITSILGYGELVARTDDRPDSERTSRFLGEIMRSARALDGLVSDLLNLNRLFAGALEPIRTREDLGALISRVVEDEGIASSRPVEVRLDQITLDVDRVLVERAVANLVKNAERYTQQGTPIWVRASTVRDGAEIVVEDAGPGVPENDRERIFEPFKRGADSSQQPGGSGVGLYLVSRFAQIHGGRAWVEEREGGGASFHMFLPGASPVSRSTEGGDP